MKAFLSVVVVAASFTLMSPSMACDKEAGPHTLLSKQEQEQPAVKKNNEKVVVAKSDARQSTANSLRYIAPFE